MTAIVCISDSGGMLFNKRRVSRDRKVIENISELVGDGALFISDFSTTLFESSKASVIAVSNPLFSADDGDFVFVEDRTLSEYGGKIKKLVIYKWNRKYPFDFKLDFCPEKQGMSLAESVDFSGSSHENITREIWTR